jgi:hypothetical protein
MKKRIGGIRSDPSGAVTMILWAGALCRKVQEKVFSHFLYITSKGYNPKSKIKELYHGN